MSHRVCKVDAYDMFGQVHVSLRIWDTATWVDGDTTPEFQAAATVPSVGATEPNHWIEHALLMLLEGL